VQQRARLADCFAAGANPCNHTQDHIRNSALYAEANVHFQPHVHVLPGIRVDNFAWSVADLAPAASTTGDADDERQRERAQGQPRSAVEVEATPRSRVPEPGTGFS
jgi:hypothetical protein